MLIAGGSCHADRCGRGFARSIVVIFRGVAGEICGTARFDVHRVPCDSALALHQKEGKVFARIDRRGGCGVRVPLGDQALCERNVDGNGGFSGRIEIDDRSFHADGSAKATLEIGLAQMFNETRQVRGTCEWKPVNGCPSLAEIEVKVPHSWTVSSEEEEFCFAKCARGKARNVSKNGGTGYRAQIRGNGGEPHGDGSRNSGFHCFATFTVDVREIISAMVSDCGPMK